MAGAVQGTATAALAAAAVAVKTKQHDDYGGGYDKKDYQRGHELLLVKS